LSVSGGRECAALDLTTARADWPAFLISSPTVADVNNDNILDIIVGTSVGYLYVVSADGEDKPRPSLMQTEQQRCPDPAVPDAG